MKNAPDPWIWGVPLRGDPDGTRTRGLRRDRAAHTRLVAVGNQRESPKLQVSSNVRVLVVASQFRLLVAL